MKIQCADRLTSMCKGCVQIQNEFAKPSRRRRRRIRRVNELARDRRTATIVNDAMDYAEHVGLTCNTDKFGPGLIFNVVTDWNNYVDEFGLK